MNMADYMKFVRIFDTISREGAWAWREELFRKKLPYLRKKYKELYNITDDETIINHEMRKAHQHEREVRQYLHNCHVFEVDEKHKFLLKLTQTPHKKAEDLWKEIRLPFGEIFIDLNFAEDEQESGGDMIHGLLLKEMREIVSETDPKTKQVASATVYGIKCYLAGYNPNGTIFTDKIIFPLIESSGKDVSSVTNYERPKQAKALKDFIINFILFLKEREVEWVEITRSDKHRERRIKQDKIPLPSSNRIKLTGTIKKYVNSLSDSDFKGKLSYQFWVRGHWRTYSDKRYKKSRGKVQWIAPFLKGEGILVKKNYQVVLDDEKEDLSFGNERDLEKQSEVDKNVETDKS